MSTRSNLSDPANKVGFAQQLKGLGRISVEGYLSGSAAFFEGDLLRILAFTGGA